MVFFGSGIYILHNGNLQLFFQRFQQNCCGGNSTVAKFGGLKFDVLMYGVGHMTFRKVYLISVCYRHRLDLVTVSDMWVKNINITYYFSSRGFYKIKR